MLAANAIPKARSGLSTRVSVRSATAVTFGLYAIPVLLCAIDRFVFDYAIGPVVLGYAIFALLISVPLYFFTLGRLPKLAAVVLSVVLSVLSAVLMLNVFVGLTMLFGVMDYDLM